VAMPRPVVGVLAIMRDKDYDAMLERFVSLLDEVVCTQASEPRSLAATELAQAVEAVCARLARRDVRPVIEADPVHAFDRAREQAGAGGSVLVAGSLFLLEDLRDVLGGISYT
jgi:dihydrofolate synthase / folylpolyglutamate synthase